MRGFHRCDQVAHYKITASSFATVSILTRTVNGSPSKFPEVPIWGLWIVFIPLLPTGNDCFLIWLTSELERCRIELCTLLQKPIAHLTDFSMLPQSNLRMPSTGRLGGSNHALARDWTSRQWDTLVLVSFTFLSCGQISQCWKVQATFDIRFWELL